MIPHSKINYADHNGMIKILIDACYFEQENRILTKFLTDENLEL